MRDSARVHVTSSSYYTHEVNTLIGLVSIEQKAFQEPGLNFCTEFSI